MLSCFTGGDYTRGALTPKISTELSSPTVGGLSLLYEIYHREVEDGIDVRAIN
jgi:hypothetical protein